MNRIRPSVRRALSVAAAAVAGVAATLAFATPAFAHQMTVTGTKTCQDNGTWKVVWTVVNSESNKTVVLTTVTVDPDGSAITNDPISSGTFVAASGSVSGEQTFPGTATSATLTINLATWSGTPTVTRTHLEKPSQTKTITLPEGQCTRVPEPKVEFTSNCDGTVTVKLFNDGKGDATYEVNGVEHVLLPGTTKDVPVNSKDEITVTHGDLVWKYAWKDPGSCATPPPPPDLPNTTGAKVGGIVAAGAGLIALGAGLLLFLQLRRRRLAPNTFWHKI